MIATESIIAQPSIARRRVGSLPPSIARARAGNLHRWTDATIRSPVRFRSSIGQSPNKTLHQTHSAVTASQPKNQSNQQYSIIALTDDAGTIVERYTYTPYGAPTFLDASASPLTPPASGLDNRITYTGREWDSTLHLHHFRARMMDPQLGRFCGRDPIGHAGSTSNLYEYVHGAPLKLIDPTGLACWFCTKLINVTPLKDKNGTIIGCALEYQFDSDTPTRVVAGKSCPKECEPVPTCDDIPGLDNLVLIKIVEPRKKGLPFFRKYDCPANSYFPQRNCLAVNAKNCKGEWEEDSKNCRDLCRKGGAARFLCSGIPTDALKRACKLLVEGSVQNCIYYCENMRLKVKEEKEE